MLGNDGDGDGVMTPGVEAVVVVVLAPPHAETSSITATQRRLTAAGFVRPGVDSC